MHTFDSLLADLEATGIPRTATVKVHSGMRAIGDVEGRADTVLDALSAYFAPGLLVLPSHTWDTVNVDGAVFDPETTPSCVGLLSDMFWRRAETVRSWHPTHSVAALGEDAKEFVAGEQLTSTPCPRGGVYGKLLDREAYILFLGCPMSKNTFVHGVEEWNAIPNRLAADMTSLSVKIPGGDVISVPQHMHKSPIEDISAHYSKLRAPLEKLGGLRVAKFGDAEVAITTAAALNALTSALLEQDPDVFLTPNELDPEELPADLVLPIP